MTIKKRLFISNILMITIPYLVSAVTGTAFILTLHLIFDGELTVYRANPDIPLIVSVNTFIGFSIIMFFTNRFLIRFVFKRIKEPLEVLSNGVNQISEGNLDYKIIYHENDEFKPVCEAFNNMAARLKDSIEEVQKNEQNRKELIAGISHDLRSPLTSIKAFVEGLLDGIAGTPESQREYLQIIKQKTDDINRMVAQLFLYSKMDMGNYPTHPEILNVSDELKDFVSASQEEYKAKGLLVEIINAPENINSYADPVQLRSVFANILGNSAKYKIKETARAIINCLADGGVIKIIFEDDGPGIPENEISRLFDVFYRSDPSRSNPNQGSGLGLAIASKALERMNGRIYAENINAGGLRIIVEIPEMKEDSRDEKSADN